MNTGEIGSDFDSLSPCGNQNKFTLNLKNAETSGEEGLQQFGSKVNKVVNKTKPKLKKQKTILMTKEIDDEYDYYLRMDIDAFCKLSKEECEKAYKYLVKSLRVIFTGSVDPFVNTVNLKKVQEIREQQQKQGAKFGSQQSSINMIQKRDEGVVEEAIQLKDLLDKKCMLYGIWEISNLCGSVPNTREGASACLIDQKLYLFGGFGRDIFNDIYYVTLDDYRWKFIKE